MNAKLKKKLRAYLVTSPTLILELVWTYEFGSVSACAELALAYKF